MARIDDPIVQHLYGLPPELFILVLDFLDFYGILYLCTDPDFPLYLVHRRHIASDEWEGSIWQAAAKTACALPVIKRFIQLLGTDELQLIRRAVQHDDAHVVELLLRAGANPKEVSFELATLFHGLEDPQITKSLLSHGVDVNARGYEPGYSRTALPIFTAVFKGRSEIVQCFLEAGANPNTTDFDGTFLLWIAIDHEYWNIVQVLINAGCDVNKVKTRGTQYDHPGGPEEVLLYAVECSPPSVTQLLIDAGANIEAKDYRFRTPLFRAIEYGRGEVVQMLLDANASLSTFPYKRGHVQPAIYITAGLDAGLARVFRYLRSYSPKEIRSSYFSLDPVSGDLERNISMINMLGKRDANIFKSSFMGWGILHYAIWRNSAKLIQTLLEGGADPDYRDPDGNTAADWASALGFLRVERILRDVMSPDGEFYDWGQKGQR